MSSNPPRSRPPRSRLIADATRLRSLLLADAEGGGLAPGNPKLLLLSGLPGTGKSTFARKLVACHPFLVVESDRLRKALVAKPEYTAVEHARVFRACHWLIDEFLAQGYPVLHDATNLVHRNRRPVMAIARKRNVPLAIVVVSAPSEVVRKRLRDREAGLDQETWSDAGEEIYSRMVPVWQPVKGRHIAVDTSKRYKAGPSTGP